MIYIHKAGIERNTLLGINKKSLHLVYQPNGTSNRSTVYIYKLKNDF